MQDQIVYLVDENPTELAANRRALETILADTAVMVTELAPFRNLADYNRLLTTLATAAFIIDQRLRVSGDVEYNGIVLASHLRAINPKLPIYILTNYPGDTDLSGKNERTVEDIIPKGDLTHPASDVALRFKARFLRRLAIFRDVLSEREERFHVLLRKSLKESLRPEETREFEELQGLRLAAIQAAELEDIAVLGQKIEELKRLLGDASDQQLIQ